MSFRWLCALLVGLIADTMSFTIAPHQYSCGRLMKRNDNSQCETTPPRRAFLIHLHQSSSSSSETVAANTTASADETSMLTEQVEEAFPEGEIMTMVLSDHRPLGCTVDESLDANQDYVFISKITEGGNADKAGLKVGDVIVGVTGLFGELTIVMDAGVEKM
jgi:hypothetical protein